MNCCSKVPYHLQAAATTTATFRGIPRICASTARTRGAGKASVVGRERAQRICNVRICPWLDSRIGRYLDEWDRSCCPQWQDCMYYNAQRRRLHVLQCSGRAWGSARGHASPRARRDNKTNVMATHHGVWHVQSFRELQHDFRAVTPDAQSQSCATWNTVDLPTEVAIAAVGHRARPLFTLHLRRMQQAHLGQKVSDRYQVPTPPDSVSKLKRDPVGAGARTRLESPNRGAPRALPG
jgi:hypothetical protein